MAAIMRSSRPWAKTLSRACLSTRVAWAGEVVVVTLKGSAGRSASGAAAMEALSWSASLISAGSAGGWAAGAGGVAAGAGARVATGVAGAPCVAGVPNAAEAAGLALLSFSLPAGGSFFFLGFTTISRSMVILTTFFLGVILTRSTALEGSS